MRKIIISLNFVFFGLILNAQLLDNLSIGLESNTVWYNNDSETGDFFDTANNDSDKHIRSNSYLKIDYNFLESFTASVQIESYEPFALLNYSKSYEGTNLGTYSLNYRNSKLNITAGHFYSQFGSGLVLRNWEDRQLGINNALQGGKIVYDPVSFISLTALYGKQRVGFTTSEGEIFGFNSELDAASIFDFKNTSLEIGLSYVGRKEETTFLEPSFNELTNSLSGRVDYYQNNFYSNAEYVIKSDDAIKQGGQLSNRLVKPGNAFLFNTGYSKRGFGIDATFRRLENMNFFSERNAAGNVFNESSINYIPGLTKQHDYLLTNIFVYQAQSTVNLDTSQSGEIGGQIDLFYKIKKETFLGGKYGTKIAFNFSYWAGLDGDYTQDNPDAGILPNYEVGLLGFGKKYFSDFSIEIRKKWTPKWRSIFYFVNQSYNKKVVEGSGAMINSNIGVIESTHRLGNGKSIRLEVQMLNSDSTKHDWTGGTIEYNINSRFSVYANDIYNKGSDTNTEKTHFFNLGGSYTKGATRLGINYGRQRAGLLCVGGVCRFVAEATGLTANLTMSF
ncbi:DUF6029 family protein [Flavobacteriaceae bacterium]|jgi:hypothetical protein|nr:DUF6029 family protein [Flavobacteriaceae bacterium]MDC0462694.1 DUF6029 family protein [Flavobacteriaceae bacterium]|tara:strand:+ start:1964 stop:3646 length:1683 start_codon:yes stop_codon:yes gene_type:complete